MQEIWDSKHAGHVDESFVLPDPSELTDEQVDDILNSAPVQEVVNRIKQSRIDEMKAAEKALQEEGPFKSYLPTFTKHPVKFPPKKESYCATRLVRPRIYEVTLPLNDGIFFVVYFHWLEQKGYTQATCYWGNIFDFTTKSATEPYPGAGYLELSRPFVKKYPHVAGVYGAQDDNKLGEHPYLTTIGWDFQPKEWWLSMRLYKLDFARLLVLGPLDCDDVLEALNTLCDAALAMMRDIQLSDAKQPKQLMNELFGLTL